MSDGAKCRGENEAREGRGMAHGTSLKCGAHDILSLASLPPAQLSQNLS